MRYEGLQYRDSGRSPWVAAFWTVLALTTALRFLYAVSLPLTGDEAYFWEWARHPALGYYDHPPMAGWILIVTRFLLGDTVAAVRIFAVLSASLVVVIVNRFTLDITGSATRAALAGLLAMALPLLEVLGVIYSTDTPLLLAGTLGGYMFHRAVTRGEMRAWMLTGACFAVVIASKFLGAPLLLACILYLLARPEARLHLATAGPHVALLLAATGMIPVLVWNARNDWATFAFNLASRHAPPALGIRHTADYLAGQALALSPIVMLLGVYLLAKAVPVWRRGDGPHWQLPAFLAAVPLGGFLALSLVSKVGLHWPGVGVPFLVVALGVWLTERKVVTGNYIACLTTSAAITVLLFLLPLAVVLLPPDWQYPLRPDKISSDQLRKFTVSTRDLGDSVQEVLEELAGNGPAFVFTRSYALSSLVAFYTPSHPEVTVLGGGSAHGRNHLYWFEPSEHVGRDAVFVTYASF
ncbi:MAG: glycosyltransferase family 39 protein, partial [bacterium]